MIRRALIAGAFALISVAGAAAQEPSAMDRTPTAQAPKPAADSIAPGKTATDAITDPAAVPPAEGRPGSGAPPPTGGAVGTPATGAGPTR